MRPEVFYSHKSVPIQSTITQYNNQQPLVTQDATTSFHIFEPTIHTHLIFLGIQIHPFTQPLILRHSFKI